MVKISPMLIPICYSLLLSSISSLLNPMHALNFCYEVNIPLSLCSFLSMTGTALHTTEPLPYTREHYTTTATCSHYRLTQPAHLRNAHIKIIAIFVKFQPDGTQAPVLLHSNHHTLCPVTTTPHLLSHFTTTIFT